jgi:hypothetical protein
MVREEEHHEKELTDDELRRIRELLVADARRQWLVSAIRGISIWLAAIAGGYLALKGLVLEIVGVGR